MTNQLIPIELTPEQKAQVFGILSVGCDRETAANFVGCSLVDITRSMRNDTDFGTSVRRTEAACELYHMRNVHEAAKDEKNWRTSVWWLERKAPERFGPRSAGTVASRHLKAFIQMMGESLCEAIQNADDRDRVHARFRQINELIHQMTDDWWEPPSVLTDMDSDFENVCSVNSEQLDNFL